jgi:hypothetical protein
LASAVVIDKDFKDGNLGYDAFGNLTVKRQYLEELSKFANVSLAGAAGSLRKKEETQKKALAGNFVMDFSQVKTPLELLKVTGAFNNSGTAQIAVSLGLFENKTSQEIKNAISSILQKGIRVFAIETQDDNNIYSDAELIEMGFSGHISKFKDYISGVDFLTGNLGVKVEEISGFKNVSELERKVEKSDFDAVKLVSAKDFAALFQDKDIETKIRSALNFFNGNMIKRLSNKKITPQYAAKTGYAFELSEIADLNSYEFEEITKAFEKPNAIEELKRLLKINSNAVLKAGYDEIESSSDADSIFAFLKAIAQKAKLKHDIPEGFKDSENTELFAQTALSQEPVNQSYIDNFPDYVKLETGSAKELYEAVKIKSRQLLLNKAATASTINALLLTYGERKTNAEIQKNSASIDPRYISKLLAAA